MTPRELLQIRMEQEHSQLPIRNPHRIEGTVGSGHDGFPPNLRAVEENRHSSTADDETMAVDDSIAAAGPWNAAEDAAIIQPTDRVNSLVDAREEDEQPSNRPRKRSTASSSPTATSLPLNPGQAIDEIVRAHWLPCDRCLTHVRRCNDPQCKKPQHDCQGPGGNKIGACRCFGCQVANKFCSPGILWLQSGDVRVNIDARGRGKSIIVASFDAYHKHSKQLGGPSDKRQDYPKEIRKSLKQAWKAAKRPKRS